METLHQSVLFKNTVVPQSLTSAAATGTAVDCLGYDEVLAIFSLGAAAAASVMNVKLQHGLLADGSDATDITGAAFTATGGNDDNKIYCLRLRGAKRYIRAIATESGAGATLVSVIIAAYKTSRLAAIAQENTVVNKEI